MGIVGDRPKRWQNHRLPQAKPAGRKAGAFICPERYVAVFAGNGILWRVNGTAGGWMRTLF